MTRAVWRGKKLKGDEIRYMEEDHQNEKPFPAQSSAASGPVSNKIEIET